MLIKKHQTALRMVQYDNLQVPFLPWSPAIPFGLPQWYTALCISEILCMESIITVSQVTLNDVVKEERG